MPRPSSPSGRSLAESGKLTLCETRVLGSDTGPISVPERKAEHVPVSPAKILVDWPRDHRLITATPLYCAAEPATSAIKER